MSVSPRYRARVLERAFETWWLPVLAVALLVAAAVEAQPAESSTRAAALENLREQISGLEGRLDQARAREATLQDSVERVGLELDLQQMQVEEATTALRLATDRVATLETEIDDLETALAGVAEDLRRRAVGLHRLGRHGYLRLFLSLRPDQGLLPAIRQLRFLVRRDEETLTRFEETREQLTVRQKRLERELEERATWEQRETERRDRLVVLQGEQKRLLSRAAGERRRLDREAEALRDKERKLTRLVDALVEGAEQALAGTSAEDFRGVLDWPVDGAEVLTPFGARRDPRYRTEVPHHGIELGVEAGAVVRTVFDGRVIYADLFEGYGPMVVVHHPGRIFSLYAGLEEIRVEKGDVLSLGSVLGASRDRLYFELRRENEAVDPLGWLR